MLQNGTLVPEDKLEKACEVISETCWGGDVEEAKRSSVEYAALISGYYPRQMVELNR